MFPIPFNFPFIRKDGSRTTIGAAIAASSSDPYILPTASTTTKGGIKVGDGLIMEGEFLKVSGGSGPTFRKVWENNLEYQTADTLIDLPDSNYDLLIVNAVYDTQQSNQKYQTNQVMLKGHGTTLFIGYQEWRDNQTKLNLATRTLECVTDTQYKLSNGYKGGDNALAAFVLSIYAVKF